eukprot:TRINITY_DN51886_c0_g1_i2.p1 TRINITY_DN51886_c0_g1~~TRINITY_DN51886_c0_g1_i2.p1  ORF type:complete len:166 (+),score=52.14 TRINITY_DN51886_c0_g1_i2:63-500(+)
MLRSLVGSEMCIRDSINAEYGDLCEAAMQADASIQSRTCAAMVQGVHTDLCITPFEDRVMVVISQTGTMGTMVLAELEGNVDGARAYSTRVCFGDHNDEMACVLARRLAEIMQRPLLVSVALKDRTVCGDRFKAICQQVQGLAGL